MNRMHSALLILTLSSSAIAQSPPPSRNEESRPVRAAMTYLRDNVDRVTPSAPALDIQSGGKIFLAVGAVTVVIPFLCSRSQ